MQSSSLKCIYVTSGRTKRVHLKETFLRYDLKQWNRPLSMVYRARWITQNVEC